MITFNSHKPFWMVKTTKIDSRIMVETLTTITEAKHTNKASRDRAAFSPVTPPFTKFINGAIWRLSHFQRQRSAKRVGDKFCWKLQTSNVTRSEWYWRHRYKHISISNQVIVKWRQFVPKSRQLFGFVPCNPSLGQWLICLMMRGAVNLCVIMVWSETEQTWRPRKDYICSSGERLKKTSARNVFQASFHLEVW